MIETDRTQTYRQWIEAATTARDFADRLDEHVAAALLDEAVVRLKKRQATRSTHPDRPGSNASSR